MTWLLRVKDKFSAAHFLKGYQGKCEKLHGHTFQVEVAIEALKLDPIGMGFDFTKIRSDLAAILPDHTLLNEAFPFNPSAENLARAFYAELKKKYPVKSVTVWESEDASATYSEDD